jgi:hypothetical protein
MNPITPQLTQGTVGELLVQLRLLQFDVQAAPPLKDSGNDLIAIRGQALRAIQVKSTAGNTYPVSDLPDFYHLLAVVHLVGENSNLMLDRSRVFLIPKDRIGEAPRQIEQLGEFIICESLIDEMFGPRQLAQLPP